MTTPQQAPISTSERIIANTTAAIAVLAFLSLIAVLLAPLFGVDFAHDATWFWAIALLIAWWGFPLALIGIAAVIILRIIANRRHQ